MHGFHFVAWALNLIPAAAAAHVVKSLLQTAELVAGLVVTFLREGV